MAVFRVPGRVRLVVLSGLLLALGGARLGGQETAAPAAEPVVFLAQLAAQEEAAEAVAQVLDAVALAARERDASTLEALLPDDLRAAAFPSVPLATTTRARWVLGHGWRSAGAQRVGRRAFVTSLSAFLGHFADIEDVRFSLPVADFSLDASPARGEARFTVALVGRDALGRREWARGRGRLTARRPQARWEIASIDVDALESDVAARSVFEDVSLPAGLVLPVRLPRLPGNVGGVWHGAAAADLDGDGWLDAVATSRLGLLFFRNDHGRRFVEAATEVGLRPPTGAPDAARPLPVLPPGLNLPMGASPGGHGLAAPLALDYDNDGDLDLFVSAVGRQRLFENRLVPDGALAFRDVSDAAGVARDALGFGAAAADVDGDGLTDVYVACYNEFGREQPDAWLSATNGTRNLFFRNLGGGRFREEAERWGIADPRWSLAPLFFDADGDGRQDLYVANDFGENALFMNKGDRFVDEARARGVLDPAYGMGAALGDYDRDGRLDLLVTNMSSVQASRVLARLPKPAIDRGGTPMARSAAGNSLFQGGDGGVFRETTAAAGPFPAGWAWGGVFVDVDNDGWDDVVTPNGYVSGPSRRETASLFWQHVVAPFVDPSDRGAAAAAQQGRLIFEQRYSFNGFERDAVYLNLRNGAFRDVSGISGADSPTDGRAAVVADFDNDGDADLLLATHEGPGVLLFRNAIGQAQGSVRLVLEPAEGRARDAFGAVVRLVTASGPVTRVKNGGSGFLAEQDPRLLFGLGALPRAERAEVSWPDGQRETFTGDFARGLTLVLKQGTGRARVLAVPRGALPAPPTARARRAGALRLVVGGQAPPLVLLAPDGTATPLRTLLRPERRLLAFVWRAGCPACREQLAALQKASAGLAAQGIDVGAVNVDADPWVDTAAALRAAGVTFPAYAGRQAVHELLFTTDDPVVPLWFLVSPEGTVLDVGPPARWAPLSATPAPRR